MLSKVYQTVFPTNEQFEKMYDLSLGFNSKISDNWGDGSGFVFYENTFSTRRLYSCQAGWCFSSFVASAMAR